MSVIISTIERTKEGILYTVRRDALEVWREFVQFRAGAHAHRHFVRVAREQDRVAAAEAGKHVQPG